MTAPFVSVVIPVYNDSARLTLCLKALGRQTYPRDRYEIVVVDNASTEDVRAVVARFPGVRCELEPKRGPAAARNRGVRASRGEVIAFTDSDCIPRPDWLEKGVALLTGGAGIVGGRVAVFFRDEAKPGAVEWYSAALYLDQRMHVARERYAITANVFMKRTVFEDTGPFEERFGAAAREDREWGERAQGKAHAIVYSEEAVVAHPAMRTPGELWRKIRRLREGRYRHELLKSGGARPGWGAVARETLRLVRLPLGQIRAFARARDPRLTTGIRLGSIVVVIWAHEASVALDLAYMLNRKFGKTTL